MMPPVSLPLNAGTPSNGGIHVAHAGAHASIPPTATRLKAPIIRIADSISLQHTLERISRHEKNGRRVDAELSAGVAALHLTLPGLRVTVATVGTSGGIPHARSLHTPEKNRALEEKRPWGRAWHRVRPAGVRPGRPSRQPGGAEFLAVRPAL